MKAMSYSIVIPAYDETQRITPTLDRVLAYIAEQGWNAEVVVVNDGSRDNTAEIVRSYAVRHPMVRLVENPGNRGKGYSVRNVRLEFGPQGKGTMRVQVMIPEGSGPFPVLISPAP